MPGFCFSCIPCSLTNYSNMATLHQSRVQICFLYLHMAKCSKILFFIFYNIYSLFYFHIKPRQNSGKLTIPLPVPHLSNYPWKPSIGDLGLRIFVPTCLIPLFLAECSENLRKKERTAFRLFFGVVLEEHSEKNGSNLRRPPMRKIDPVQWERNPNQWNPGDKKTQQQQKKEVRQKRTFTSIPFKTK